MGGVLASLLLVVLIHFVLAMMETTRAMIGAWRVLARACINNTLLYFTRMGNSTSHHVTGRILRDNRDL